MEVETEEAQEIADLEIEILILGRGDALLVGGKDILRETAEVIEEEMNLETEVEVEMIEAEEEIPEFNCRSLHLQATLSHGLEVKSNVIEMIDTKELKIEPEKLLEVAEVEEDLHHIADLELPPTTLEPILMTKETEEVAREEETETSKEVVEEVEPQIASEKEAREATLTNQGPTPTDLDTPTVRASRDPQEGRSTVMNLKEV